MAVVHVREYTNLAPEGVQIPVEPAQASQSKTVSTTSIALDTALLSSTKYILIHTDAKVFVNFNGTAHATDGSSLPVPADSYYFTGIDPNNTLRFITA